jgi:hypothetical protein
VSQLRCPACRFGANASSTGLEPGDSCPRCEARGFVALLVVEERSPRITPPDPGFLSRAHEAAIADEPGSPVRE